MAWQGPARRLYLTVLGVVALGWLGTRIHAHGWAAPDLLLCAAMVLYLCAHLARMLRLALLTLDQRKQALALAGAHAATALPNFLLPFKSGEILRLMAFCSVLAQRRKALAVWLTERLSDVIIISLCTLVLNLLDVELSPTLRWVLLLFVLASAIGLLSLVAIATTFVYLNRHLVLASHSRRGLLLLKASHLLRSIELEIWRSIEGRLSGLVLLSLLIWGLEIAAYAVFAQRLSEALPQIGDMFATGMLASLGAVPSAFVAYQTNLLAVLTLAFLATLALVLRLRHAKS